jgi:hypothetical protein
MKSKIFTFVLCLICLLSLVACSEPGDTLYSSKYVNFSLVEEVDSHTSIWVDKTTGVLYWVNCYYGYGFTPLYNADGSLKNIKDFE